MSRAFLLHARLQRTFKPNIPATDCGHVLLQNTYKMWKRICLFTSSRSPLTSSKNIKHNYINIKRLPYTVVKYIVICYVICYKKIYPYEACRFPG